MYWIKNNIRRIKRIVDFLPIVWRGHDFDYRYALELFHYQLGRTSKYLNSDKSYSLNSNSNSKKIETAIELGNRVFDEYYMSLWYQKIEDVYGPNALKFHFEDTGRGDGSSYLKYNYEYWENAKEVEELVVKEIQKTKIQQEKAERIYWEYLRHNIRHWWD